METRTEVYLVYADAYTGNYGTSVQLVGIYDNMNLATKTIASIKRENPSYRVIAKIIELNKQYPVFCLSSAPYSDTEEEFEKQIELDQTVIKLCEYIE